MSNQEPSPPFLPVRLIRFFLKSDFAEEIEGDMEERYFDNVEDFGYKKASRLYWTDTLKLLRPKLIRSMQGEYRLNTYGMLANSLKVTWRQMRKQKVFSSIKIGGLAMSIAACILITLYINDQLSYDKHYENGDRIYRVVNQWSDIEDVGYWSNVHGPLKEAFEDNIPEMELVARAVLWPWGDAGSNHMRSGESTYSRYEEGFIYADPELLEILEVPMVFGSRKSALSSPNSIVISKSKADVYFPNENPVGKNIVLNNDLRSTYTVGGVMEDFPSNSHLQTDFIMTLFERKNGPGTSGWCCTNYSMYVQLSPGADRLAVQDKTGELRNSLVIGKLQDMGESGIAAMIEHQSYYLQSVGSIYLNPEGVEDFHLHGSYDLLWIFGCMAVVILTLAMINFVNLSTANSINRSKEIGLRKVVGSFRSGLIAQHLIEACMYSVFAVLLGLCLAWAFLPVFNQLSNTALSIPWDSVEFILSLALGALLVGLLAGIYPAFVLSSFKPIQALKGHAKSQSGSLLRSGMVIFQFAATLVLIVGSIVTHQQFGMIMNKPLGYNKDQVINLLGLDSYDSARRQTLKEELLKLSYVKEASLSDYLPVEGAAIQNRGYWIDGRKEEDNGFEAARWVVDEDYLSLMEIELVQGRDFKVGTGNVESVIINEEMATLLGLEDPIGARLEDMFGEKHTVVGVVKDFHFESIFNEMRPLALVYGKGTSTLSVRIESSAVGESMAAITKVWDAFSEKQAIRYTFMDERFEDMYVGLERANSIFIAFASLSIIVACLGLLALSIHMIAQRTKEMSVRKVLGASVSNIFLSLTFDFLKLVLVAIVVAMPIAWYFADFILEDMVNRIDLSWDIFALAAILSVVIALGTVSYEALKAALVNPAKQLRSE